LNISPEKQEIHAPMILETESHYPTSLRHFPATALEQNFSRLSVGTAPCGEAAG